MDKQPNHEAYALAARRFLEADRQATQVAERVQAGRAQPDDYKLALDQARKAAKALGRVTVKRYRG